MPLINNNDMIKTIPAYRSNNSFHIGILPRRARDVDDLIDTEAPDEPLNKIDIKDPLKRIMET